MLYEFGEYTENMPFQCDSCMTRTLMNSPTIVADVKSRLSRLSKPNLYEDEVDERISLENLWHQIMDTLPEERPHTPVKRPLQHKAHYVYILKLSDATFYIGQTTNLPIRLKEHKDGLQQQTKDKDPKLVYFERCVGDRLGVTKRENHWTLLNRSGSGRRRLREMIENYRAPLRLLDLDV